MKEGEITYEQFLKILNQYFSHVVKMVKKDGGKLGVYGTPHSKEDIDAKDKRD